MLLKRYAVIVAMLSVMLSMHGMWLAVSRGGFRAVIVDWSLSYVALVTITAFTIIFDGPDVIAALTVGFLCGFTALTLFSFAFSFVPATVASIVAVIVDAIAHRRMVHGLVLFWSFWLAAWGVSLVFLAMDWARSKHSGAIVTHAPIVVSAAWIFLASAVVCASARFINRRHTGT